jgi:hypothetical protein
MRRRWRLAPGIAGFTAAIVVAGAAAVAGPPKFTERASYPAVDFGVVTSADLNGDGIPDLIETFENGVGFWFGGGDGTFTRGGTLGDTGPIRGTPPSGFLDIVEVATGLITSDRHVDLVVKGPYDGPVEEWLGRDVVTIFRGIGDGTFVPYRHRFVNTQTRDMLLGHLNRDDHLDLALAAPEKQAVLILYGRGDRGFRTRARVPAGLEAWDLDIGRFDHDSRPDLSATLPGAQLGPNQRSILLSRGGSAFGAPVLHDRPGDTTEGAVGDFNGDRLDDFAEVGRRFADPGTSRLQVLASQRGGRYAALPAVTLDGRVPVIQAGQLGGGGIDLLMTVVRPESDDIAFMKGNGDGTFAAPQDVLRDAGFLRVVDDLNGDRRLDLITAWFIPDEIEASLLRVFLNTTD